MAVLDALVDEPEPKSYGEIFKGVDEAQVVVVTGEEDNVFTPDFNPGPRWAGFDGHGTAPYKKGATFQTETLSPGKYVFQMTPDPSSPGGDADLYLKVGAAAPIDKAYKCPSYKYNSNERCVVTLTQPAQVFMQTSGDKQTVDSAYLIRGFQLYP
jgi:hypothetical protein